MSISRKTGSLLGKIVDSSKTAPKKSTTKLASIKQELVAGYREVVPAKPKED